MHTRVFLGLMFTLLASFTTQSYADDVRSAIETSNAQFSAAAARGTGKFSPTCFQRMYRPTKNNRQVVASQSAQTTEITPLACRCTS